MLRFLLLISMQLTIYCGACIDVSFEDSMRAAINSTNFELKELVGAKVISMEWISYAYEQKRADQIPTLLSCSLNITDPVACYDAVVSILVSKDYHYLGHILPYIFPILSEYQQQSLIKALFSEKLIPKSMMISLVFQCIEENCYDLNLEKIFREAFEDDEQIKHIPFFIRLLHDVDLADFVKNNQKFSAEAFARADSHRALKSLFWSAFSLDEELLMFLITKINESKELKDVLSDKFNQYAILCSVFYALETPAVVRKIRREVFLQLGHTLSYETLHDITLQKKCLEITLASCECDKLVRDYLDQEFMQLILCSNKAAFDQANKAKKIKIIENLLHNDNFLLIPEFLKELAQNIEYFMGSLNILRLNKLRS